ncbi:MAG: hypothetical protein IJK49_10940 [Prevotella sp.]|nr:hypothetical protein [Prevotella sp.]
MKYSRQFCSLLFAALFCLSAGAQNNPKEGYIVTSGGEKIHGTIDYQSRAKSALVCRFKKSGETSFRDYSPSEIDSYAVDNEAVRFVSRTFPIDGVTQTFFAELLLKGHVSLYRYDDGRKDVSYFVENQAGDVAAIVDYSNLSDYTASDAAAKRREMLGAAMPIFDNNQKVQTRLWKEKLTAEHLVDIVREYNTEVSGSSGGNTIDYVYSARKSSATTLRFAIEGGLIMGGARLNDYFKPSMKGLHAALGGEVFFPRSIDNLSLLFMLGLNYLNEKGYSYNDYTGKPIDNKWVAKIYDINLRTGVNYSFLPKKKFSPIVCGGVNLSVPITDDCSVVSLVDDGDDDIKFPFNVRLFLGGGVEFKLSETRVRATARYELPVTTVKNYTKGLVASIAVVL